MSGSQRTPSKKKEDNTSAPATPSTPKAPINSNQLGLPIPYSLDEAKHQAVANQSPNKIGKPTSPNTVKLSSKNDTPSPGKGKIKSSTPVKFYAGHNLFPSAQTTSFEYSLDLLSSQQQLDLARDAAYEEFIALLTKTASFKENANFSAQESLIKLLNNIDKGLKKEIINKEDTGNEKKEDTKKTDQEAEKKERYLIKKKRTLAISLESRIKEHTNSAKNLKEKSKKILNEKLKEINPGFEDIEKRNYAKPDSARALIPTVLEIMTSNDEVLSAIKALYDGREKYDRAKFEKEKALNPNSVYKSTDPALLFSDITLLGDGTPENPTRRICLMSFSSAEIDPNISALTNVMKKNLENKPFDTSNGKYEIIMASHLSDRFRHLLNNILKALNSQANTIFINTMKEIYKKLTPEQALLIRGLPLKYLQTNAVLEQKKSASTKTEMHQETKQENNQPLTEDQLWEHLGKISCVTQHPTDAAALKNCAEKPFISELAKAQMRLAIDRKTVAKNAIQLHGIECIEFTFRRKNVNKVRGGKPQEVIELTGEEKISSNPKPPTAKTAKVFITPETHNNYLKRPSDDEDPGSCKEKVIYEVTFLPPCTACFTNKPSAINTLFPCAMDNILKDKNKEQHSASTWVTDILPVVTESSLLDTPTKNTPTKSALSPCDIISNFLKKTPQKSSLRSKMGSMIRQTSEETVPKTLFTGDDEEEEKENMIPINQEVTSSSPLKVK